MGAKRPISASLILHLNKGAMNWQNEKVFQPDLLHMLLFWLDNHNAIEAPRQKGREGQKAAFFSRPLDARLCDDCFGNGSALFQG